MKDFLYSAKIKNYFKVACPSIPILIGQFVFALIPNILIILLAIPSAKIITSLTIYDYAQAKIYLLLDFIILAAINIAWYINNIFYSKQIKHIYKNAQLKIYDKLILMTEDSLKTNSKEKLINIMTTSLFNIAEYSNIFAKQIASYMGAIVTLIIVFFLSYIIGFIILAVSILIYILFKIVNLKISKNETSLQQKRDQTCEIFSDIVSGREEIFDLTLKPGLKEKYINSNLEIANLYKKENFFTSLKYNWIKILWKGIVTLGTLYFITRVQYYFLSLTTYLIVIPYLSECIEKFILAFDNYYKLEITNISILRIKTIFEIKEKDIIFFGHNILDNVSGSITFSNISYEDKQNNIYIVPFSLSVKKNEFIVFKGNKNCGKKIIFNLLKREYKPNTGTITIDSINIYDFDTSTYKKNLSYTSAIPYFFDMSILDNLKLVEPNKKQILKILKLFCLEDFINSLPAKLHTNINRTTLEISSFYLFLLGIVRSYLSKSEIIMIYEFPQGLNDSEIKILDEVFNKIKNKKTIIIFTATNISDKFADKIILVKNGKITV